MELSLGYPVLPRSLFALPGNQGTGTTVAAAPSGSESVSNGSSQTENLLPAQLTPPEQQAPNQEVSGNQEESKSTLQDAAAKANKYMQLSGTYLQFVVSDQTGHVVVNVVNSETNEVVRQIPKETLQRIANRSTQLQGLLFSAEG